MSDVLEIDVAGRPVPWQRAGTHGTRHFTPRAVVAQQQAIRRAALDALGVPDAATATPARLKQLLEARVPWAPDGPLLLDVAACYRLPKQRRGLVPGDLRPSRPDVDNLVKNVLDALTGVIWSDDAQVAGLHAVKLWDWSDATTITVTRP